MSLDRGELAAARDEGHASSRNERMRLVLGCGATAAIVWSVSIPRAIWGNDFPPYLTVAVLALVPLVVLVRGRAQRMTVPITALSFGGVAAASIFWSASPRDTARALVLYAALALLAVCLHAYLGPRRLVAGIAVGTVLVVLTSFAAVWWSPDGAFRPASPGNMFVGLYKHWNILSYTLCLLLPALLAVEARRGSSRALKALGVTAVLLTLALTRSASGIVTGVVLVAAWSCLLIVARLVRRRGTPRRWTRRRRALVLSVSAMLLVGITGACVAAIPTVLQKDFSNLSGRVPLWDQIGYAGSERPWQGFGFGAVWSYHWLDLQRSATRDLINERLPFELAHGHNGLMDLVIQVGIIGVLAYLSILLRSTWRAARWFVREPGAAPTWVLLLMLSITVLGMTEPLWMVPLGWTLVVMAACATDGESLPPRQAVRPRHARTGR